LEQELLQKLFFQDNQQLNQLHQHHIVVLLVMVVVIVVEQVVVEQLIQLVFVA
jgi:hypothetical protein